MKPELIIMVGNIASGKSTWIKEYLAADGDSVVVSKDALRIMLGGGIYLWDGKLEPTIHTMTLDIIMELMSREADIIIDGTNMNVEGRSQYLQLTKKFNTPLGYDYKITAVVMPKLLLTKAMRRKFQFVTRNGNQPQDMRTWQEVWQRKDKAFEQPTAEEGFDSIIILE